LNVGLMAWSRPTLVAIYLVRPSANTPQKPSEVLSQPCIPLQLNLVMATSRRMRFLATIAYLTLLINFGVAQRPNSASVCDYYAQTRFGTNSSATQLKFMQNVVCLAFEGGSSLNNVSSDLTGILRPGKFLGNNIDLLPYFNGSKASTNVNNAPIGINWMDQGGTVPLASFLAGGDSQTLVLANTSNQ
jgi:hypothetical protein